MGYNRKEVNKKKYKSKDLEKEGWISFELYEKEFTLTQDEVDELVLDANKWMLKLNVKKLKNNKVFLKRVDDAKERKNKNV